MGQFRDFSFYNERYKEKREKLFETFPNVWEHSFWPEVGIGWYQIIWDLSEELEPLVVAYNDSRDPEFSPFKFIEMKEKFGALRIYTNCGDEAIRRVVGGAEEKSENTCEICGAPGKPGGRYWIKVLCEEHQKEDD